MCKAFNEYMVLMLQDFHAFPRGLPSSITESIIGWLDFAHHFKLLFRMGPATWELVVNDGKVVFQHVELSQTPAWMGFFDRTLEDRDYATGW